MEVWRQFTKFSFIFLYSQIVLTHKEGINASPSEMAEQVVSYLEEKGYLRA